MGRAMINIVMTFAQLERETIVERVTDNYYFRANNGYWAGGYAPYGYKIKERTQCQLFYLWTVGETFNSFQVTLRPRMNRTVCNKHARIHAKDCNLISTIKNSSNEVLRFP